MSNPLSYKLTSPESVAHEDIHLVPASEYLRSTGIAPNLGRSCGYVAAALLMSYWEQREQTSLLRAGLAMPVTHPAESSHHQRLHDRLLKYGLRQTSWAFSIYFVLRKYKQKIGLGGRLRAHFTWCGVYESLRRGEPVILFGGVPDPSRPDLPYINHAVLAYGYWEKGADKALLVHYGWPGQQAWLLETPFRGSALFYSPDLTWPEQTPEHSSQE